VKEPPQPDPQRADYHHERAKGYREAHTAARRKYFHEPYGNEQIFAVFLAVSVKYQRRGIARMLVQDLLDRARREPDAKVITLFASEMAEPLYRSVGFKEVGRVKYRLENDNDPGNEGIDSPAMVWTREVS
jgi:ribosomal protein S18 acetylase RimI-like enzyme